MANGLLTPDPARPGIFTPQALTRIHSIAVLEQYALIIGQRCVVVTGEP